MSLTEAVKSCFANYATFTGRARRSEYWFFTLFIGIVTIILEILIAIGVASLTGWLIYLSGILMALFGIGCIIPSLAVAVRRLHDIGKSGLYYLCGFIPLVGPILLLIWAVTDSQPEENKWGTNPKK